MQALPTIYNGYHFRSRTEARWAVFFEAMGIEYIYEHEDFLLSNGKRYLPDFYLPKICGGIYAEVKGEFTHEDVHTCGCFCYSTRKTILMLEGVPDFKGFKYFSYMVDYGVLEDAAVFHPAENRIWIGCDFADTNLFFEDTYDHHGYKDAVEKSRAARFENFA